MRRGGVPGFPDISGRRLEGVAHRKSSRRPAWAGKRAAGDEGILEREA